MFSGSQLSEVYGAATVQSFEATAKLCAVTEGVDSALVKYGIEKEVVVANLRCQCEAFMRLKLCAHVMAVAKFKGPGSVTELISRAVPPPVSSQLKPPTNAGKKVSSVSVRKGGRSNTSRPSTLTDDDYIIVRGNSRRKVCNGCRTSIIGERFVVRHTCRLSFMKRDDSGKLVSLTPTTPGSHHFHIAKTCILKPHPNCTGRVVLDPTLNSACQVIRALLVGSGLFL